MAGLLKPFSARLLIGAIRQKYPDLPIHVHTHDTAGQAYTVWMYQKSKIIYNTKHIKKWSNVKILKFY